MTALLNLVVPAAVLLWAVVVYVDWRKRKNVTRLITHYTVPLLIVLYVYQVIQPSYLPKTSVPELRRLPFEHTQRLPEDRLKQPRHTEEQREERLNEMLDYREKVERIIEE